MPAAPLVERRRYLIVVPRQLFAAALVVRRKDLTVVPSLMPAAPRRYLAVVYRPLPEAPLVEHRRYLIAVLGAHWGGWAVGARALASFPPQVLLPCRYCAWRVGEAHAV